MKNKKFFYLQYNKINWKNQEKTKINSLIYDYIIQNLFLKSKSSEIAIFDIGFGIGLFFKILARPLVRNFKSIILAGCEPSRVNYNYFLRKRPKLPHKISLNVYRDTFQDITIGIKFDFITAIYTFTNFVSEDLERSIRKIHSMLRSGGKFILVVAEQKYLENKLKTEQDLSIEKREVIYKGKRYKEILHYSDIPKIGKIIDYNREDNYYLELFKNNKFSLSSKKSLSDNGFICTIFVFKRG